MTKRTVYRIPPCPIWDLEATESWLGDLAEQGLHLKRMHSLLNFAAFQAGPAQPTRYRLTADSRRGGLTNGPQPDPEAVQLAQALGWQYVDRCGGLEIWCTEDPAAPELNTDPALQALTLARMNRQTLGQMAGYLVQLLLNSLFFFGSALFWVQGGPILMLAALGLWAGLPILLGLAVLWADCGLRLWGLARQRRKLAHGRELDHKKNWRIGKNRWWVWRGTSAVLTVAMLASILWLQLGSEAAYTHPLEESAFPLMPAPLAEELGAEPKLRPEYNTDRMTSHSDPLFTYRQANQWADLRTAQGTITLDWDITYMRTATPWLSHQAATALRHARRFGAFSRAEVQTVSGLAADEAFTWDNGFSTVLLLRRGREVALVQLFSHYADDTADALPLDVWAPLLAERLSG